jgi:hypothetical protein
MLLFSTKKCDWFTGKVFPAEAENLLKQIPWLLAALAEIDQAWNEQVQELSM